MELAEAKKSSKPNSSNRGMVEESFEQQELLTELPAQHRASVTEPRAYNSQMIANSKLPESVKKIMTEFPTQPPDMFISEQMVDTRKVRMDLMYDEREPEYKTPTSINELTQNRSARQATNSRPVESNDEHIKNIVREEMLRVFGESYIEQIKKDTIKQTLATLKKKGLLKT